MMYQFASEHWLISMLMCMMTVKNITEKISENAPYAVDQNTVGKYNMWLQ